ncbi:MAG: hypothetical protein V4640_01410 [Verrucomicrobiota bacterium]
MKRCGLWLTLLAIIVLVILCERLFLEHPSHDSAPVQPKSPTRSQTPPIPEKPTAAESLLVGYANPATPPIEDLRKIHRVAIGYFSVIKDASRFPIGGNEDFSAALRGENSNREVLVRPTHPAFSAAGLLIDRWGSALIVHPVAWQQLELRSTGPDRLPYNADDLVLSPSGNTSN